MKKRARKPKKPLLTVDTLHFRLCHVCYFLNEAETEIGECVKCHNTFVPDEEWEVEDEAILGAHGAIVQEHEIEEEEQEDDEPLILPEGRRRTFGLAGLTAVF